MPDEAGRLAYAAGHQAALALIFQQTGRALTTHGGAHSEFALTIKDDPRFALTDRRFLGRAYRYKQATDYGIGEHGIVTDAEAEDAIHQATALVDKIEAALQETTKEPPP